MKDKIIIQDTFGKKTPTHIFVKVNKDILKNLPDAFFMDLTIDDVRDANKERI